MQIRKPEEYKLNTKVTVPSKTKEKSGILSQESEKVESESRAENTVEEEETVQQELGKQQINRDDTTKLTKETAHMENKKTWTPEQEEMAWEDMLSWSPIGKDTINTQMKDLMNLYTKLLEAILKNTTGSEQRGQLQTLDRVVVYHLEQMMDSSLEELNDFFRSYGSTESIQRLRRSLYYNATGKTISPDQVKQNWEKVSQAGREIVRQHSFSTKNATEEYSFFEESTTGNHLYGKLGKTTTQRFQNEGEIAQNQLKLAKTMQKDIVSGKMQARPSGIYHTKEMQQGEKFASLVNSKTENVLKNPTIMVRNEPMTGLRWAINQCKTELFLEKELPKSDLRQDLITAEEKMTASHLNQIKREAKGNFQEKQVYDVYQYVMKEVQGGQKPSKAIQDGFYYALKYCMETGKEREQKKNEPLLNDTLRQELQFDIKELEKNWEKFILSLGYPQGSLNLQAEMYRFLETRIGSSSSTSLDDHRPKQDDHTSLLWGSVVVALVAILFFFFFS